MIVVRIDQLGAMRNGWQRRNAIEMRVDYAIMVVIRACVNVLKRR